MVQGTLAVSAATARPRARKGVVLVYHGLTTTPSAHTREGKYWVSADEFRQLLYIRESAHRSVSLDCFWEGSCDAGGGSVVFTFDDGRSSDYEIAYPLLAEAGIAACFFLNSANIGAPGYLTWEQAREMHAAGMAFQSHSHDHVYLTRLSRRGVENQLLRSKQTIEDRLGNAVTFLSAPYGEIDAAVRNSAFGMGYHAICSSLNWPARSGASILPRVCVAGATSFATFRRLVAQEFLPYACRGIRAASMYIPKQLALRVFHFNQSALEREG